MAAKKLVPDNIIEVLEQHGWNVLKASKDLGLNVAGIFKVLKDLNYGITFKDSYSAAAVKLFLLIHNPDPKISLRAIEVAAKFAAAGIQVDNHDSNNQSIINEEVIKNGEINIG